MAFDTRAVFYVAKALQLWVYLVKVHLWNYVIKKYFKFII